MAFRNLERVVVIGAGVGGLTTAAFLAQAGLKVDLLEAHVYPGGCAGTFYHQHYHFDAGATLAGGFYPGGPMDVVAHAVGIEQWPARSSNPAMVVHLPDGSAVTRWTDEQRWKERAKAFGPTATAFWQWQENTADALWNLALRLPSWPPQTVGQTAQLIRSGLTWLADSPQHHQTHLFRAWAPRLTPRLWLVGDTIFPGQSTAAVALGGLRVARDILAVHPLMTK